jgi:hypothetical protein
VKLDASQLNLNSEFLDESLNPPQVSFASHVPNNTNAPPAKSTPFQPAVSTGSGSSTPQVLSRASSHSKSGSRFKQPNVSATPPSNVSPVSNGSSNSPNTANSNNGSNVTPPSSGSNPFSGVFAPNVPSGGFGEGGKERGSGPDAVKRRERQFTRELSNHRGPTPTRTRALSVDTSSAKSLQPPKSTSQEQVLQPETSHVSEAGSASSGLLGPVVNTSAVISAGDESKKEVKDSTNNIIHELIRMFGFLIHVLLIFLIL